METCSFECRLKRLVRDGRFGCGVFTKTPQAESTDGVWSLDLPVESVPSRHCRWSQLHCTNHIKHWHLCCSSTLAMQQCSVNQQFLVWYSFLWSLLYFVHFPPRIKSIISCSRGCVLVNYSTILVQILKDFHHYTQKCSSVKSRVSDQVISGLR